MTGPGFDEVIADVRRVVDAARAVWTRRLVDYSRANSLLFFRDLKVGTLDVTGEVEAVERLLAGDTLAADALVPADESPEAPEATGRASDLAHAATRQKVRGALVALQRKALSNLEEKGLETLH